MGWGGGGDPMDPRSTPRTVKAALLASIGALVEHPP